MATSVKSGEAAGTARPKKLTVRLSCSLSDTRTCNAGDVPTPVAPLTGPTSVGASGGRFAENGAPATQLQPVPTMVPCTPLPDESAAAVPAPSFKPHRPTRPAADTMDV